jgi:hypothetical protein
MSHDETENTTEIKLTILISKLICFYLYENLEIEYHKIQAFRYQNMAKFHGD